MSDGRTHDKWGCRTGYLITAIPVVCALSGDPISYGYEMFLTGVSCVGGTLFLSPDLDHNGVNTVSLKRWKSIGLGLVWEPYRKLIAHRSILSHSPILGTALRVCYLGVWLSPVIYAFISAEIDSVIDIAEYIEENGAVISSVLFGIELSALIHYWLDGLFDGWIASLFSFLIPKGGRRSRRSSRKYRDHMETLRLNGVVDYFGGSN